MLCFGFAFLHDFSHIVICAYEILITYNTLSRFVREYSHEPWRGYGRNVVTVFEKLQDTDFRDLYGPSSEQFEGRGSFGNGGAMRIVPMALFCRSRNYDGKQFVVRLSLFSVTSLALTAELEVCTSARGPFFSVSARPVRH